MVYCTVLKDAKSVVSQFYWVLIWFMGCDGSIQFFSAIEQKETHSDSSNHGQDRSGNSVKPGKTTSKRGP